MVVLTLSSCKNNFTWHAKFEKYQKSRFFKKLMLDEFFVGWVLTIKNKNFRCCGTFLSQNSSWCTSSINCLKKSFFDNFRFLNCGFVDFIGRILIYPAEYRPIGHIFGKKYLSKFFHLKIPHFVRWIYFRTPIFVNFPQIPHFTVYYVWARSSSRGVLMKKIFTRWKSMKFGLSNAVSTVSLRPFNPEIS